MGFGDFFMRGGIFGYSMRTGIHYIIGNKASDFFDSVVNKIEDNFSKSNRRSIISFGLTTLLLVLSLILIKYNSNILYLSICFIYVYTFLRIIFSGYRTISFILINKSHISRITSLLYISRDRSLNIWKRDFIWKVYCSYYEQKVHPLLQLIHSGTSSIGLSPTDNEIIDDLLRSAKVTFHLYIKKKLLRMIIILVIVFFYSFLIKTFLINRITHLTLLEYFYYPFTLLFSK